MNKIALGLSVVMLVAVTLNTEAAFAFTKAGDWPNSGICPDGHKVKDLALCQEHQAQKPKH
jgi:hypothetical protein